MYPPRSEKYRKKKQEKQKSQNRFWLGLNLILILIIVVLGTYFILSEKTLEGSPGTEDSNYTSDYEQQPNALPENDSSDTDNTSEAHPAGNSDLDDTDTPEQEPEAEAAKDLDGEAVKDDPKKTEPGERVLIHFAGDTIFSSKVADKLEKEGYDYPYRYVKELFQNDDLSIVNLETPVTDGGTAAENKTFVFKSSPKALPEMAKAGIDAVNLANNHTLDQGTEGLLDTIEHLKQNGVHYFGAGKNSKDAYAPVYIDRNGIKIAICGFTRVIPESHWAAGKNPGVAAAYDSTLAVKSIKTARKNADLVLVVAHWGKERSTKLEEHQTELARAFIDAGADLVVGGHAHVLQGLEQYKGKWIAYSTGNFIFTKSKDAKTWETAVFAAECSKSGECSLKLIPFKTELGQPVPMNEEDGAKLLKEVQSFSPGVSISASGEVKGAAVRGDAPESVETAGSASASD